MVKTICKMLFCNGKKILLMAIENLALQLLDVFAGQHSEFLLETLGEILGRIESYVHREFAAADG